MWRRNKINLHERNVSEVSVSLIIVVYADMKKSRVGLIQVLNWSMTHS